MVAEQQVDDTTADQQREHRLSHDLQHDAQHASTRGRGQFVVAVRLQTLCRLRRREADVVR